MSKVLITGAKGFIGHALCRDLREKGHTLTGVSRDRSRRAGPENIPLYNVPEFGSDMDWSRAVTGAEAIVHLAARVHQLKDKTTDPLSEYRRVNVEGTRTLAAAAADAGVKRLVFLSSVKVNGEKTEGSPFSENDTPAPVDPYGLSKWEAEQELWKIAESTDLEVVVVRAPLVYGPNVGGNFAALARAVLNRRPLPLDAIINRRSLIYVANLTSAITLSLEQPRAAGETFLVGDGEDMSTGDLICRMAEAAGINNSLIYCPLWILHAAGTLTGRRQMIARLTESLEVDSDKIRDVLGWSPPFSIQEGLQETMASFQNWNVPSGSR